ncbi:cAMP and cAMP-inhibited cGMP 3',5'-cyclic phosphodiesterase 10A [Acetobacter orientalis]|uniref:cAMP and cAMP-inhibited cGMP 3',5'-cyclic phosphodiesterase 10A, partial n=1 Tax=Acetobacter orientalis TaxID=146474 RepID=A0A2Z5ZII8_9PROT|nr:cAMP and cAMP-inhibited cGMP 3',5'-cyclic phosphodiesterase 10A [Acetobacter orientalis]
MPMIAGDAVKVFLALTDVFDEKLNGIQKEMMEGAALEKSLVDIESLLENVSKYKKLKNLFNYIKIKVVIYDTDSFVDQLLESFGDNPWFLKMPSQDIDLILDNIKDLKEYLAVCSTKNCVIYYGEGVTQAQETMAQLLCKG